mmetsp:Transcript_15749/g.26212  ORF Transcript_15749/g.26212 Transcript_15749/m.26212 type:complete len:229 (+) Transcript_15749:196-882(+)
MLPPQPPRQLPTPIRLKPPTASMLSTLSPWREASSSAVRPSSRKSRRRKRWRARTITSFAAVAASQPSKRATTSPPIPPSAAVWPAASPRSFLWSVCPPASPSSLSRRVDSASSFASPRPSSSSSPARPPSSTSAQLLASCWAAELTLAFGTSLTVVMRPCRPSAPTACPMSVPPTPSSCRPRSARSKRWLRPCSASLASATTRGRLGPWTTLRATSRRYLPWCFGYG